MSSSDERFSDGEQGEVAEDESVSRLIFEPLPRELTQMWAVPEMETTLASRVLEQVAGRGAGVSELLKARLRRVALGLVLGGMGVAAAFVPRARPTLGPDVELPTRAPEAARVIPVASSIPGVAPAETERRATPLARRPQAQAVKLDPPSPPRLHYPLCGCSSGAVVCSCVDR